MFIDAACIYGNTKSFSVSINTLAEPGSNPDTYIVRDGQKFVPFDLTDYSIYFKILGAATANAAVLAQHLITQTSDVEVDGQITDATNGEFTFTITSDDTIKVGLGKHPIMIELVDSNTLQSQFILTEGGENGEFSKIYILQV